MGCSQPTAVLYTDRKGNRLGTADSTTVRKQLETLNRALRLNRLQNRACIPVATRVRQIITNRKWFLGIIHAESTTDRPISTPRFRSVRHLCADLRLRHGSP